MEPKKDLKDLQGFESTENSHSETAENTASSQEEKNSTGFSLKDENSSVAEGNQSENFSGGKGKDLTGEGEASLSAKHRDKEETPPASPEGGKSAKGNAPETAGGEASERDGKPSGETGVPGMADDKTGKEPPPPEEEKKEEEQPPPEEEKKDASGEAPAEEEETAATGAQAPDAPESGEKSGTGNSSGESTSPEETASAGTPKAEKKISPPEGEGSEQHIPPEAKEAPSSPKKGKKVASSKQPEKTDYSKYNQVELVNAMRDVLDHNGDHNIKDDVEAIKAAFYKNLKEETEQQKKEFLEAGGSEEDFKPEENPYEKDIKNLLKRYRHLRSEFNKKLEEEKEINLQLKYQVIEEIKGLINKEESINKTFQEFRELQQKWREIGLVPQSKMKNLWETYHFHVENFYDYIKINKELRDLDLKKNLEMKIKLCEQAEELLLETNIVRAFNSLQKLHERWREIGPVPRENKDDLWERFKASTSKINKKHQEYFENRKAEQKKNLEAKRALCEKVEEINEIDLDSHKAWSEKSKEVINLQKIWRTIGFAPRKDNNKIYDRFRTACDTFFDAKRAFYAKNKEFQQNNLQLKIDLCLQAEALKESTDWKKTTQDYINIQKQWKEIGPVPRKQSDAIWKRFRTACDHFFDRKSEHFAYIEAEQQENLQKKEQLIEEVKTFQSKQNVDENLEALKDFQRRWTEIGHVPIKKKDVVQKDFREAINKLFDDLNIDESKRNLLKFRTKMASFSESSRGQNKMRLERDKYVNKLKQLESDLVLLDNNVGFFSKSKNAESLINDVKNKIEQTREKIDFLRNKIRVIDEMDQSDE